MNVKLRSLGKKTLIVVLSVMMVLCMMPQMVFAEENPISGGTEGADGDYKIDGGCIQVQTDTPLTVSGDLGTLRICVNENVTANITIDNITIDMSGYANLAGIELKSGATLNLILKNQNLVKSGYACAGINVPEGTTLNIDGTGILNVNGGELAAGIGGGAVKVSNDYIGQTAGTITINGGTINATGGRWGAGIGGGCSDKYETGGGNGGTITINDGIVNATAGADGMHNIKGELGGGSGIGGGGCDLRSRDGSGAGNITIKGGTVTAKSNNGAEGNAPVGSGAAIGGGCCGNNGNVTIEGGNVTAIAGDLAAGIGNGRESSGSISIEISGGNVSATGGRCAAGIGSGWLAEDSATILITGGNVIAKGGDGFTHWTQGVLGGGAGIGSGSSCYGANGRNVTISGGIVTAIGGDISSVLSEVSSVPAGIGAGSKDRSTHIFSTGKNGSAVIIANTSGTVVQARSANQYITDQSVKANWLGTIIEGDNGQVYGAQTLTSDITIETEQTLDIPSDSSLTIASGVTLTNNGAIVNNSINSRNNGIIIGDGSLICNAHNWENATCIAPSTCAFCKITTGTITEHTYTWIVDSNPTVNSTGLKHEECLVCHAVRNENVIIPKLTATITGVTTGGTNDGNKTPTTGDTSDMGLWIALLMLAAGTTAVAYRKKTDR